MLCEKTKTRMTNSKAGKRRKFFRKEKKDEGIM
jgi:hypothetical protein